VDQEARRGEDEACDQDRAGHPRVVPPAARIAATPPTNDALVPR
jgi:hypothetical protein